MGSCPPQVLIEKILRACPEIKRVFLLSRGKGGVSAQQRIDEVLQGPVRPAPFL